MEDRIIIEVIKDKLKIKDVSASQILFRKAPAIQASPSDQAPLLHLPLPPSPSARPRDVQPRALRLGFRLVLSSSGVLAAFCLPILVRIKGIDAAALILALALTLYLLRGRRLSAIAIPLGLAIAASAVALALGLLRFQPIPALEFGLAWVLVLVAARRLRLERLAAEQSRSQLEARVLELHEMTLHDTLTGLYNRRYASEAGRAFVSQFRRYGNDLHALMIDIDHFKLINDEFGHSRGDEVLKGISTLLRSTIRESDVAARIGGEEFLVLLPKAGAESAQNIANRIRDLVGTTFFEDIPWTVTVSLGITGIREGDDFDSLVDRADTFLYNSKRSGRNRVSGS